MSPFDRAARSEVIVRIGAQAIELWRSSAGSLVRVARASLPRRGSLYDAAALVEPLRALDDRAAGRRATLVLESAFVPVVLADTGKALWRHRQLDALVRHRLDLAHGSPGHGTDRWQLSVDHRFGDRFALAFALPPEVEAALAEAGFDRRRPRSAWLPALAWSLERFRPWRCWPRGCGWWAWPEQDRTLLAGTRRGRIEALHPAVSPGADDDELVRIADAQARRGRCLEASAPLRVARWEGGTGAVPKRDRWVEGFDVGAAEPSSPGAAHARGAVNAPAAA